MSGFPGMTTEMQAHRPQTIAELQAAAKQMARDGLGDHSIADVLQMDVMQVRRLIGECIRCGE